MHVTSVALRDFRSYAEVDVALPTGPIALVGPNGQGKTNLVEALVYLSTLGSHRVATDAPLIRHGAPRAVIAAGLARDGREVSVELELTAGRANRARINRSPVTRPRDILGLLRTVLFAPEDLALVKGDPGGRRTFIDDLLVARTPRLAGVRSDYERVLKQRNALLKSAFSARRPHANGDSDVARTLSVWNGRLAELGAVLIDARWSLLLNLTAPAAEAYATLTRGRPQGIDRLTVAYSSSIEALTYGPDCEKRSELPAPQAITEFLLEEMSRRAREEIDRGVTLVGPHRDDVVLGLGALPARGYASHGESWSVALALRLASYRLLCTESDSGGEPVLILDDVFAELDTTRRAMLTEQLAGAEQVIVTAAVPDDVPVWKGLTRYDVRDGGIRGS